MNKIGLIIQREFTTRVRKKSFLIMTILGPVFFGALMIAPALLASLPEGPKNVAILDQTMLLLGEKGNDNFSLRYLPPKQFNLDKAKEYFQKDEDLDALVFIPRSESGDPDFSANNATVFGKKDVSINMENYFEELLEKKILAQKLSLEGVDPEVVARAKTNVHLKTINLSEDQEVQSATPIKMAVGYAAGFFIYIFVFLYSAQIMRGVIEEKTNRIVEVIISSVKPFQLMMGKILGIGFVGMLQFTIWVVLSFIIYQVVGMTLMPDGADAAAMAEQSSAGFDIMAMFSTINFPLVLASFLFFFIGGYLLYGALLAGVGSAVDSETDTQQFMTPISLPLILSIVVSTRIIEEPDGPLAFWMSIIPFTSPIAMMVRLPFGVPAWQLALSMGLLVAGFIFTTWLAGRIYRVGILMYGKKVTWSELIKWARYKNG